MEQHPGIEISALTGGSPEEPKQLGEITMSTIGETPQTFNLVGDENDFIAEQLMNEVPPSTNTVSVPNEVHITPQRPAEPGSGKRVQIDPTVFRSPVKRNESAPRRPEDHAYDDLEKAIARKQEEFRVSMQAAVAHDEENRMLIAEGIEKVEGSITYMAEQETKTYGTINSPDTEDDEFDKELDNDLEEMDVTAEIAAQTTKKIRIAPPLVQEEYVAPPIPVVQKEDVPQVIVQEPETSTHVPYESRYLEEPVKEDLPANGNKVVKEDLPANGNDVDLFKSGIKLRPVETKNNLMNPSDIKKDDFTIDPKDFSDIDLDGEDSDREEKIKRTAELQKQGLQNLKSEILAKVVNTASKLDISSFKLSKKTASLQNVLRKAKENKPLQSTATWALSNAQRSYIASPLTGPEIVMLSTVDEGENSIFTSNEQQARILYNHDENPYKPTSFHAWCKTIPYADIDDIFFAEYLATFSKANYLPYECKNDTCMNMELKDRINIIDSMVKFKNDDMKGKFQEIREQVLSADTSIEYESVVVPINDYMAIGFKLPSIYNMLIELRSVGQKFIEKYAAIITVIMSIDEIYDLDHETGEFSPVDYKKYPGDISKTFKTKIATYAKILNTMSTNEYNVLIAYVNSISSKTDYITNYMVPEEKCSKCGHVIEGYAVNGKDLVFSHQRLVDIATISIE